MGNIHVGKSIALNIEVIDEQASNYSQRIKQRTFYENNSFLPSGYLGHKSREKIEMLILGGTIDKEEIDKMYTTLLGCTIKFF